MIAVLAEMKIIKLPKAILSNIQTSMRIFMGFIECTGKQSQWKAKTRIFSEKIIITILIVQYCLDIISLSQNSVFNGDQCNIFIKV